MLLPVSPIRERPVKPGRRHQRDQFLVLGEVDRRLGEENEWIPVRLLPCDQIFQEGFDLGFITYEVIVNQKDTTLPTLVVKDFDFSDHLRIGFNPGSPAV